MTNSNENNDNLEEQNLLNDSELTQHQIWGNNNERKIDPEFNETLFKMWMNGKSMSAIVEEYRGTAKEFSGKSLRNAKKFYGWDKRKEEIGNENRENIDEKVRLSRHKQLEMLQMAIDMNLKLMSIQFKEFNENPEEYIKSRLAKNLRMPNWFARDAKEMLDLLKAHNFVVNDALNNNVDATASKKLDLTAEEEAAIWGIMKKAASRKALGEEPDSGLKSDNKLIKDIEILALHESNPTK